MDPAATPRPGRDVLSAPYTDRVLLVAGLSADARSEVYKLVDLAGATVHELRIGIDDLRARQLRAIVEGLEGAPPPYGHTEPGQLLGYFLHPHEFVQTSPGDIVVSFKQAPYVRILGETGNRMWPREEDLRFDRMLSSTDVETAAGVVGLTAVRSAERFARYRGASEPMGCELLEHDLATGAERVVGRVEPFIRDTLHQFQSSPAGYQVGVDMSLEADTAAVGFHHREGEPFDVAAYAAAPFPRSGFFVRDAATGATEIIELSSPCAAHAEIDPLDPSVFYVSCHNISKWQNNVVVHGPGALEKYRWTAAGTVPVARFSDRRFLRVTSQATYVKEGQTRIAVPAFPNRLYILDASLRPLHVTVLFPDEEVEPPFVCPKNSAAPLYLAITESARHAVLTSATELFVVDLDDGALVDRARFCEPGTFLATAHVDFVARSAAVRRLTGHP